jgi:hypothetical protein
MHSETNILDFINHDCVSNDYTAARLKQELSVLNVKADSEGATASDIHARDVAAKAYAQAQQFLCYG